MEKTQIHIYSRGKCYIGDTSTDIVSTMKEAFILINSNFGDYAIVNWPEKDEAVIFRKENGKTVLRWQYSSEILPNYPWI